MRAVEHCASQCGRCLDAWHSPLILFSWLSAQSHLWKKRKLQIETCWLAFEILNSIPSFMHLHSPNHVWCRTPKSLLYLSHYHTVITWLHWCYTIITTQCVLNTKPTSVEQYSLCNICLWTLSLFKFFNSCLTMRKYTTSMKIWKHAVGYYFMSFPW